LVAVLFPLISRDLCRRREYFHRNQKVCLGRKNRTRQCDNVCVSM
jgi:hypothetical protein